MINARPARRQLPELSGALLRVLSAASALAFTQAAVACSCVFDEPNAFLYPDKTVLPSNARGMLFVAPAGVKMRPEHIEVRTKSGQRLRATIEPLALAKDHPFGKRFWRPDALRRVGVAGGFKPGETYTMTYRRRTERDQNHVSQASFTVAAQAFDLAALRPAVAVHGALRRTVMSFATGAICASEHPALVQDFIISATGADPALLSGLTTVNEVSADGGKFALNDHVPHMCADSPPAATLATAASAQLVWPGCKVPRQVRMRAWLGMLEVDERVAEAVPVQADWSRLPPGACSSMGQMREALARDDIDLADRLACGAIQDESPEEARDGPSAAQWRRLLAVEGDQWSCARRALAHQLAFSPGADARLVRVHACDLAQQVERKPEEARHLLAPLERIREMRSYYKEQGRPMAPLPEQAMEPLNDAILQLVAKGKLKLKDGAIALAQTSTTPAAIELLRARVRLHRLAPGQGEELLRLLRRELVNPTGW